MVRHHSRCKFVVAALGFTLGVIGLSAGAIAAEEVKSPDGNVVIRFLLQADGAPAYAIDYLGHTIVLESKLGFEPELTRDFLWSAVRPINTPASGRKFMANVKLCPTTMASCTSI